MLFHYQGKPEKLLRVFKCYRGIDQRMRQHRTRYLWRVIWFSILYLIAVGCTLMFWGGTLATWFWLHTVAGLSFLTLAWWVCVIFRRFPSNRNYSKAGLIFGLVVASFILFILMGTGLQDAFSQLLTNHISLSELLLPWMLASFGVWVASRWITYLRLRDEMIEQYELDFLVKLLYPILHDLPADAACTLVCNPFTPLWSENLSSQDRNGRRFKIYDDVLLDFQVKLADASSLSLQSQYRRVDKYKIRKMKYKGTKHRLALVCRVRHPALARLGEDQLQQFGEVCQSLQGRNRNYATQVRHELAEGKVVIVTKRRWFGVNRDLTEQDLPSVQHTLQAIRRVSAFTALAT